MMLVEGCLLLSTFAGAYLFTRFGRRWSFRPQWLAWILARNLRGVCLVAALALLARGLLLPVVGIPQPRINDEYSYLLMADTFSHGRLANPTPPSWQHFETFHVNVLPSYHSKYPVAQGLVLAFGQVVFHQPWIGVYLSTALLCGTICWALQAFVPPGWALLGGVLAVFRLALFSYWMNSYWGGSVAALGGAVALGAVVRLFQPEQSVRQRVLLSCTFGAGLLILATSRPYEGLALSMPLMAYFAYHTVKGGLRGPALLQGMLPVVLIGVMGLLAMGYYNRTTTGSALLMPYELNYRTYWPLPYFLGQKANSGLKLQDPVFDKFYQVTEQEYGHSNLKSMSGFLSVESGRLATDWFFYVGPALSLPVLIGLISCVIRPHLRIVVLVVLSTTIALALCVYSLPHYAAPATVATYIFATEGLRYLWEQKALGERAFVVAVCLTVVAVSLTGQTGSAVVNTKFHFPDQRTMIAGKLADQPGKQLVLVSYDLERHYPGNELVHNGAEFASQKIVWARSKGAEKDTALCAAFPDRRFWSATTDDTQLSLSPLHLCAVP